MFRLFRSLQRLVLFLSVLACRCATVNGRPERVPAFSDPPEAVTLKVRPEGDVYSRGAIVALTKLRDKNLWLSGGGVAFALCDRGRGI